MKRQRIRRIANGPRLDDVGRYAIERGVTVTFSPKDDRVSAMIIGQNFTTVSQPSRSATSAFLIASMKHDSKRRAREFEGVS